jgi:cyclopropane fatty-acyl-phospholipid synthase-like methyltransferase
MSKGRLLFVVIAFVCLGPAVTAQRHQPSKPDHMQHRFDDPEQQANSFDDPSRDAWQMPSRVIEVLGLSPSVAVADIGAGTGYFSVRLANAIPGGTVYAVDLEPSMLEHIRQRALHDGLMNIVTVQASDSSPNLPRPVDVVLVVDTYHHLPNRPAYFRELQKSLSAGGRVAIIDFRKDSPDGPPAEFRFDASQIISEMKQADYQLVGSVDFLPRQHFLVFRPATADR